MFQFLVQHVFPATCLGCDARVGTEAGLCPSCWRDTQFIGGAVCDSCGAPVDGDEVVAECDACIRVARPWDQGRAALAYTETGRGLAMALKHGDRHDIARHAAPWLARAARGWALKPWLSRCRCIGGGRCSASSTNPLF